MRTTAPLLWVATGLSIAVESHPSQRANIIHDSNDLHPRYDFVIIGGGASGLTVADRLTEDPSKVLVPGLLNLTTTPYWFNLTSAPQRHLGNRTFQVTIAAAVGGGTVINGMFWDRGARADYDAWEELGAKGWGWDNLLPYFKKSETFTPPASDFKTDWDIEYDVETHGSDGPIQVSYPRYQFPVIKYFFKAFRNLGITTPKDPSDGSAKGVFWVPSTLDPVSRTRSYARIAHYDRVNASRPNYHVLPMSAVTKIKFDKNNRVTGVEYVRRKTGETFEAQVKKEVVLAAGAVHTPQILMLSGIGEKNELRKFEIECISDIPSVGHNFQDHPTLYFVNEFQNDLQPNVNDLTDNSTFKAQQLHLYNTEREGAYTLVAQGGNTAAFIPLPQFSLSTNPIIERARSENLINSGSSTPQFLLSLYEKQRAILLREFAAEDLAVQETGFNSGFIPLTLLHPLSRGKISINTTMHLAPPVVDYETLSSPTDLNILIEILRFNRRLLQTTPLSDLAPFEIVPGANITSDADLRALLPHLILPTYQHPCCTAPMLPLEDGGVVDPKTLLVYGTERLSIVDASLMPMIPGAHLMTTVYGVAEKAADIIKKRYGLGY